MAFRAAALVFVIGLAACAAQPSAPPVTVELSAPVAPAPTAAPPGPPSAAPLATPSPVPAPAPRTPPEPERPLDLVSADDPGGMVVGSVQGASGGTVAPSRAHPPRSSKQPWSCRFPPEADKEKIDEETAVVRVFVDARGLVTHTVLVRDPGHGFGREAEACTTRRTFVPAEDEHGKLVPGSVVVKVRFERPGP